jgi:hypothetical protein
MKFNTAPDVCLTEHQFSKMAATGRNLLVTRKKNYKGVAFEADLSALSGVGAERINSVLSANDSEVGHCLTGVEWERVLSYARVFPEDLLQASDLSGMAGCVSPTPAPAHATASYAASHHGDPKPSAVSDQRIVALFDVMSDFFFLATANVKQPLPQLEDAHYA